MPKFSGGVYVDDQGYLRISAGPCRDRRVHELVAEAMLGRNLNPGEDVHHRNGNKLDPRWRNLKVLDHGDHSKTEAKRRRLLTRKDKEMVKHYEESNEGSAGTEPKWADTSFP